MSMNLAALGLSCLGGDPERITWKIGEDVREAIVCAPTRNTDAAPPLVFVFHGHGGSVQTAQSTMPFHKRWPEAVVVYMQGLPTPGKNDSAGNRAGWQKGSGGEDRDLKFFDAALATMKEKSRIDEDRVYATGHSNGGGFTYLLLATRGDVLAAVAPSSAGGAKELEGSNPRPVFHVAGERDTVVPSANQKRAFELLKALNGCAAEGKEWAKGGTRYESSKGAPLVTFIHPGALARQGVAARMGRS